MTIFGLFNRIHIDPTINDPVFGELTFRYLKHCPHKSYWLGTIPFEPTGSIITIALPGNSDGPNEQARQFAIEAGKRFRRIKQLVSPKLRAALLKYSGRPEKDIPENLFDWVKLVSIDIADATSEPIDWEIAFEAKPCINWCFISIPMESDVAHDAVVDT